MFDNEVPQYFQEVQATDPPESAVSTPADEVREAVLAIDPGLRLRAGRISTLLAEQGITAPVDQVRGALQGL